jgi:hypothetical protein
MLLDYDGPRDDPLHIDSASVLRERIEDESVPFGHCYALAAALLDVPIKDFT